MLLTVQINPDFYKGIYPNYPDIYLDCNAIFLEKPNEAIKSEVRNYLAQIVWEMTTAEIGHRSKIGSILYLLLEVMIAHSPLYKTEDMPMGTSEDLIRLKRIIRYIDDNLHKRVTLREIAAREHISYSYLSHFIKNRLGMGFQEYLNQARLSKTLQLLIYSDKSLEEISDQLGFSNFTAFNRRFKEEFHLTPYEYRDLFVNQFFDSNHHESSFTVKKTSEINVFPRKKENDTPHGNTNIYLVHQDVNKGKALQMLFSYLDGEAAAAMDMDGIE
ncbi:MAG: helix-turn-helix transcriptional regulator [Clostridia bacterium]|nr:helix-turn-helix transcriptional regulator [Clostridia bacterium]